MCAPATTPRRHDAARQAKAVATQLTLSPPSLNMTTLSPALLHPLGLPHISKPNPVPSSWATPRVPLSPMPPTMAGPRGPARTEHVVLLRTATSRDWAQFSGQAHVANEWRYVRAPACVRMCVCACVFVGGVTVVSLPRQLPHVSRADVGRACSEAHATKPATCCKRATGQ